MRPRQTRHCDRDDSRAEGLYARHGFAITLLAWSITGNRDTAIRIVARTLAAPHLQPPGHVNAEIRERRRELSQYVYQQCLAVAEPQRHAELGTAEGASDEVLQLVLPLQGLPPNQRDPILLCSLGGHTHREAADLLQTSIADLTRNLRAGLRAFADVDQRPEKLTTSARESE